MRTSNFARVALGAESMTQQDLLNEINALKAKVEQLESKQQAHGNKLTKAEVDTAMENVLRDADRRSEWMQVQGCPDADASQFVIRGQFQLLL